MLFAALTVAAPGFYFFNLLQPLFVQWQIFECAGGILHEGDLGIKAYAVEVFITQGAASCVFSIGAYSG